MKIAFIYPGQGSQYEAMGNNLYEQSQIFKATIDALAEHTSFDLKAMLNENNPLIHDTKFAQASILSMSIGVKKLLNEAGVHAEGSCGLSLGEYAAMVETEVVHEAKAIEMIEHRAFFMHEATQSSPGKMAAVLSDVDTVEKALSNYDRLYIANYNLRKQLVVSGDAVQLNDFIAKAKTYKIKRVVPLETSGAFHSPFMKEASEKYQNYLNNVSFQEPFKPLYINTTGKQYVSNLKNHCVNQITHPVRFYEMIETMIEDGFNTFIECGPKSTLSNLVKKIDKTVQVYHVENMDTFHETIQNLKEV